MMSLLFKRCVRLAMAAAWGLLALAASAAAQPGPEPVINPTGRVLEMAVPLNYGQFYLGDLEARITPDQKVLIPRRGLLAAVKQLLREDAFARLEAIEGLGEAFYIDLADLRAGGFDFSFDPGSVSIRFNPTLDQKVKGNISVQARRSQTTSPNAADPATVSAYVNLRSAADYVGRSPSGREGLKAPRLDLEGAARWQGMVVEAEATFEPDDVSLFGEHGEGFRRRGTRIVRDFEAEAVRASLGDVYPAGTSFQFTPDLLGISLERSYSKLQPGRNIRSTSRRSFRIERPSRVDIQVNGISARRLRLDPGDYNVGDLPVGLGANDIVLVIEDDVGNVERLEFSIFSSSDLLETGLSEWALSAGVPSRIGAGEPDYSSYDVFMTGFFRQGLSESVTAETHLQGNSETLMGGLGLLFGSSLGLISLEGAASLRKSGEWGAAFDTQYALADIEDPAGHSHRIRLAAKLRSPDFTAPSPEFALSDDRLGNRGSKHQDWLSLSANYGTELPFHVSAFMSLGYGFGIDPQTDSYQADLGLARAIGDDVSLGVTGGYSAGEKVDEELSLLLRLQYRPDRETSLAASHDVGRGRSSASFAKRAGSGIGAWQTSLDITHEAAEPGGFGEHDEAAIGGAVHYTGNRANIALSQETSLAGLDASGIDQCTSLRIETALAFADGHVAIGRPVANGFAIVSPHAGLAENDVSIGKRRGGVTAETDFLGPALLPSVSPYTLNRVEFEVDDLPPGYDLGDGLFDLTPGYQSGYALKVGSDYTITALGTLIDVRGKPIALLTGTATEAAKPEKKVELFTNRSGRFTAQGLSPGRWTIEMASRPPARFEVEIPAETVGLYRTGTLHAIE